MDKDNSIFDFDNDPEFNENFYKNIEKALGDSSAALQKPDDNNIKPEKKTVNQEQTTPEKFDNSDNLRQENAAKELNSPKNSELVSATEKQQSNEYSEQKSTKQKQQLTEDVVQESTIEKLQPSTNSEQDNAAQIQQSPENAKQESLANISEMTDEDRFEDELININASLAKQISDELDMKSNNLDNIKRKKRLLKIRSGVVLTLLCLVGFGFFFGFTKPGNQILMKMGVNLSGTIWDRLTHKFDDSTDVVADIDYLDDDDLNSDAPELDPSTIVWPDHPGDGRQEEGVYNILLLGEEAIGMGDSRGRTDVIVIATLNTNNKTVKLTSLMRDMLVQIPGYKENKLNTAFEKGGLDLMYETIALNFDLRLDGCVMVNFENFEKIIDYLGGLDITLTAGEANYLNTTNYISNPAYRNVVEGTQHLNGNQVLGYARVRKRSTITGNNNDYGRTDRHRIVLNAIYEKCKSKSKTDLASMMLKFLPMITTDIDSDCFQMLLNSYIDMGMSSKDIEQLRIPADGAFEDNVRVRGMSVLIPDLDKNIDILHSFIFGEDTTGSTSSVDITGSAANTASAANSTNN